MLKPLTIAFALLATQPCLAQRFDPNTKPPVPPAKPAPPASPAVDAQQAIAPTSPVTPMNYPVTASLLLGTQGIGLEARVGIKPQFYARFGGAYLPANTSATLTLEGRQSDAAADGRLGNIHALAEYQPFKKASWLRVSGGLGYFFSADAKVTVTPSGTYKYGDIALSGAQMGNMKYTVDWSGVAPYLGLSLLKAMPRNRFNVNLDLGTYYLSKPKVSFEGSGILADNAESAAAIEKNLEGYRWLPVLQVCLSYKIR